MHVLAVTILISLCLAGIFVVSFILESKRRQNGSSSPEHDALLPFDDEDDLPSVAAVCTPPELPKPAPPKPASKSSATRG